MHLMSVSQTFMSIEETQGEQGGRRGEKGLGGRRRGGREREREAAAGEKPLTLEDVSTGVLNVHRITLRNCL